MKFKKTYKFAWWSSIIISTSSFTVFSINSLYIADFDWYVAFIAALSIFVISFFVIQHRVEKFIYQRIAKIYKDSSSLDVSFLDENKISTDMKAFSQEMKELAINKSQEIEILKIKENYRREFLGNISHELKTPLFTVQGYLLTLKEGAINDLDVRDKYLERASDGLDRLVDIVKDLNMISKLESEDLKLEISNFNSIDLVQNVFDMLEMKAKKRDITLRFSQNYEYPIIVSADRKRIEQVLTNLVMNSIKYGNIGGSTVVSLFSNEKGKTFINISDDGEGIKPEDITRIFERFYRVEKSRTRDQGGSGLGLSIVKHLLDIHKEKIEVYSNLGKGTEFIFSLKTAT
ncbi:MAG: ATP-binding protein [Flavobacteriaceae bacterium]|nr:ATP-binding protein [Flavobacteriaceae bacterium]